MYTTNTFLAISSTLTAPFWSETKHLFQPETIEQSIYL